MGLRIPSKRRAYRRGANADPLVNGMMDLGVDELGDLVDMGVKQIKQPLSERFAGGGHFRLWISACSVAVHPG